MYVATSLFETIIAVPVLCLTDGDDDFRGQTPPCRWTYIHLLVCGYACAIGRSSRSRSGCCGAYAAVRNRDSLGRREVLIGNLIFKPIPIFV